MKRLALVGVVAACVAAPVVRAQTDQEMIDRSVLAAPANARNAAMVVKWAADGKRVVLRRLPLGKYTLKWFGEGVSQTATLDVDVDRVTGGELVLTSSVPR